MTWEGLPLVIFGGGGISKEVYTLIKSINKKNNNKVFKFLGFIGENESEIGNEIIDNFEIISSDESIFEFTSKFPIIGMVIPIGNPNIKKIVYSKIRNISNIVFPNIIDPNIDFDKENLEIGKGNIISSGVNLTCDVSIGDFNLINLNCTIGHDTEIGNFNVINPISAISGNVCIESCCLVGTGAQILQGLRVKDNSTIGAGAVVIKDVESNTKVVGIPAKPILGK